jgi:hypothetical protein
MIEQPVSLEYIQRRVDAANTNVNDIRRSMLSFATRFDAMEARFTAMEARFTAMEVRIGGLETRMGAVETRLDAMMMVLQDIQARLP